MRYMKTLPYFDDYLKLLDEPPAAPKVVDPYHYYNVAAIKYVTAFLTILDQFETDRSPPHHYMCLFNRASKIHSLTSKIHKYPIATVDPNQCVINPIPDMGDLPERRILKYKITDYKICKLF